MTLRLNFEGETGAGHIESSRGKVWRCEDYVWFSVVVTGVIRRVERGVRGGRTKPVAGVGYAKEDSFRGLQRTPARPPPPGA